MSSVKWQSFRLDKLFISANGDFDIKKEHINGHGCYVITAGLTNNGVLGKTDVEAKIFPPNTITIDMFGSAFYRDFEYKMVTHARVFSLLPRISLTKEQGIFISASLGFLPQFFGYENMCSWQKIKDKEITLPVKNGEIDFDCMSCFIKELQAERLRELQAYLRVTGLSDCVLSEEEQTLLQAITKNSRGGVNPICNNELEELVHFSEFTIKDLFAQIQQGERLTKADQIRGDLPFVMSGTTNTGVVGRIGNRVQKFPSNSISIDIFGNVFYRAFEFGASDDVGVYWNKEDCIICKHAMLYVAASLQKSLNGKYDYGYKLRASKSHDLTCYLPEKDGKPHWYLIAKIGRAVEKSVIADVVAYADREMKAYEKVIQST